MGRKRIYAVNDNYFENIDSEDKAYWLGFIVTDGCVTHNKSGKVVNLELHLKLSDKAHLEKLLKCLDSNYPVGCGPISCKVSIVSKKMVEDLAKYGVVPRKTGKCYKSNLLPEHLEKHFWRGCIDGDGNIGERTSRIGNKYLQNSFYVKLCGDFDIVNSFKGFCIKTCQKDIKGKLNFEDNIYNFKVHTLQAMKVLDEIYNNSVSYLDRKFNKYLYLKNKFGNKGSIVTKLETN